MHLNTLFNPRSVAVVGATADPHKVGYALMKNILAGSAREVYALSLAEPEVMGLATYKSVKDLPGPVDLAVIAVPAKAVAGVMRECAEVGIKSVIVISAGFKEAGDEGKRLEEELTTIARENDMALLGPNCLGIMDAQADWNASFAVNKPHTGNIAFVSQSGALGTALLDWANQEGVGFSKFVSLGNEASLTEVSFLEHLAHDPDTRAILLYLERVADGPALLATLRRITKEKPIIVVRAGRSSRGAAAVASHTGSLAPADAVFGAALRQAGAIPVDSISTLFSLAKLFGLGVTSPLTSLAILTNGGGPSVNTADLIDLSGHLSLVSFDDPTKDRLRAVLPPMAAVNNPIDVIGDAGPDRYDGVLKTLVTLPDIDAILTIVTPQMMTDPQGIAEVLLNYRDHKPIIPIFMGGETVQHGITRLLEAHMPVFHQPSDAVAALEALATNRKEKVAYGSTDTERETPRLSTRLVMYPIDETQSLLSSYEIPLDGRFITNPDVIPDALLILGQGPYVLKVIAQSLVHKSDLGAVALNLADEPTIRSAWSRMQAQVEAHTPGATIDGMLVQRMVSGVECIIGMKRDPIFGPVIVFGLGGIFVEILKDAMMRVAPLTKEDALDMIHEIKGYPLLTGARGTKPVNLDALASTLVSLSHLALEHPDIEEIDLNPVIATPEGIHLVDARLMKRESE